VPLITSCLLITMTNLFAQEQGVMHQFIRVLGLIRVIRNKRPMIKDVTDSAKTSR